MDFFHESFLSRPRNDWRRRGIAPGSTAPTAVSKQSELRDSENLAARLDDRSVHLTGFVLEDPKLNNPPRERLRLFHGIFLLYSKQNKHAGTDARMFLAVDEDSGTGHALDDGSHLSGTVECAQKQLLDLTIHLTDVTRIDVPGSLELRQRNDCFCHRSMPAGRANPAESFPQHTTGSADVT